MAIYMTEETLAERLRSARHRAGLTQRKAGEAAGVDANTVARYESGKIRPSLSVQTLLSRTYEVPLEWLQEVDKNQVVTPDPVGVRISVLTPTLLVGVPIVGAISVGGLIEGWQSDLGTIAISSDWDRQAPRAYALKVTGNSLLSDGIIEGDIVIVDPDAPFVDGKIYAVRSGGQNETVTALHVYIMTRRRYKLVSGEGEITEVDRNRTQILGRIRWSMREH